MKKFKDLKVGSIFSLTWDGEPMIKFKSYSASNLKYNLEITGETLIFLVKES